MIRFLGGLRSASGGSLGIDPGPGRTRIWSPVAGLVACEPSLVVVERPSGRIALGGRAVGEAALAVLGRSDRFEVVAPLAGGRSPDFELVEGLLRHLVRRSEEMLGSVPGTWCVSHGLGWASSEIALLGKAARRAGARTVRLVPGPVAGAFGAGLSPEDPQASMVVDLGSTRAEIAVVRRAVPSDWLSIPIGGDDLDVATARSRGGECTVAKALVSGILTILDSLLPEERVDVTGRGIVLVGSNALLRGLDAAIAVELGIPARVAADPASAVARGLVGSPMWTWEEPLGE